MRTPWRRHADPNELREVGRLVSGSRLFADARALHEFAELPGLIRDYRRGLVPLGVPIAWLHHHARAHAVAYLQGQTFLEPHPRELMLRNEI